MCGTYNIIEDKKLWYLTLSLFMKTKIVFIALCFRHSYHTCVRLDKNVHVVAILIHMYTMILMEPAISEDEE